MRQQGIEHLGQVWVGLLETDSEFRILLFPHDDTHYGLPLFPKQYQSVNKADARNCYVCTYCGHVDNISTPDQLCVRCKNESKHWAKAINKEVIR